MASDTCGVYHFRRPWSYLTDVIDRVVSVGCKKFATRLLLGVCMPCFGYAKWIQFGYTVATDLERQHQTCHE